MQIKTSRLSSSSSLLLLLLLIAVTPAACGGNGSNPPPGEVTFWQDVAPIYNAKCVHCHQEGGIGPFRLDNYADAKTHAALELLRITDGTMPPYFMVHDDSCGSFQDDATLTAAEKATIAAWVNGAQAEGTKATLTPPPRPMLSGALEMATPSFAPVPQGGALAEFDDYRCFLMDPPNQSDAFLTGYDIAPGDASIVHHVLVFIVDPAAPGRGGRSNAAIMQELDDASPDRLGWPCFGAAGDGVDINGVPVTWAPGQGVVSYPTGMGVPVRTTDKLVVQMHYNLVDPASAGKTDSTTVRLRFADTVDRALAFLLPDPFLDSLESATPESLPSGQANTKFTWALTGEQLGLGDLPYVDLVAVMPHMHERGVRQTMLLGPTGNMSCASRIENWDFHWQEFYFYRTTPRLTAGTQIEVTCEYDTSRDRDPVFPGWGTRNEMCLNVLMVALPPQ
jgi:hypothetical protein